MCVLSMNSVLPALQLQRWPFNIGREKPGHFSSMGAGRFEKMDR